MATPSQTPEQRELALIGKVELRIALADSDEKLTAVLKTYLAPLLLKLGSEHASVRNKVISVAQHVNTRITPVSIQLPVAALVKQFKEQDSSFIRHFDLLYIQQGVGRLNAVDQAQLLPVVVSGISKSGTHGPQIFNLFLRLLESFPLPPRGSKEDHALRTQFEVSDDDTRFLATWIGKFLLFTPSKATSSAIPGLSSEDQAFVNLQSKEHLWDPALGGLNLLRTKTLAAKLMSSGLFNDQERFLPALFASADPASTISDVGDDMLKRALPATDLEDEGLVRTLFSLYFGQGDTSRVRAPLRLKILNLLNKSTRSTSFSNNIMRLVDDGIASPLMDGEDVVMSNSSSTTNTGREATKLRAAVFQYVNFAVRYGPSETLHTIAPRMIDRLRDFLENQGWPKCPPTEDLVSRSYSYEVIGLLAKAGPQSVLVEAEHPSFDLLRWLFESLARDTSGSSIIVSIEESLSTVLSALSRMHLEPHELNALEEVLIEQMNASENLEGNKRLRSTRYVAVRFANRCLPYASVKGRWVDILGLGATGDRAEVREEAERGLSPYWYQMLNGSLGTIAPDTVKLPSFDSVMEQFFPGRTTESNAEPLATARQALRQHAHTYHHMTDYARRILLAEAMDAANLQVALNSDWERRIDTLVESDEPARKAIKQHIIRLNASGTRSIGNLVQGLFVGLTEQHSGSKSDFVELLTLLPDDLVISLVQQTDALLPSLQSNDSLRRIAAARVYGVLASHPSADSGKVHLHNKRLYDTAEKWEGATGAMSNHVNGAVIALAYYFGDAAYRGSEVQKDELFQQYARCMTSMLIQSRDNSIRDASHRAMGQLARFQAITSTSIEEIAGFRTVVDKMYETAKDGNEPAILALGECSMILPEDYEPNSDLAYVEEQLHKLHEIRQAEVHFSVGEALSYVASGWKSTALATKLDIDGPKPQRPERTLALGRIADRVLSDTGNTKPTLKKASVMWLLCLVQFCGHLPEIQERLPKCQTAFKRCLGDRDELVQETASRGLGLIYEKGDRRLKDDLVRDLVSSFSSDRSSQLAGSVSAETQLFEPGALPTNNNESVSTYKDIMSLASEVGDSSLVYRFMSMASSNAIWSSRAAFGKFGLSNVLSDSSVDGYLANNPKLYPKLFRYRFDPSPSVQRSMNDIWNALVKDSTATIDTHFDAIMEDLLTSILGKEWRARQASCAAIADLVQGRSLDRYEAYLERIWTQCFKVLDDIKESVRAAASSLARVLTGVLTRALEADHSSTKNASAMLKHVLPFLLSSSGMESSAQEVQAFSVHTLLEIIKKSNGTTLRPFIPELVERLLASLSTLEPEAVNYLHLNASKYGLTEGKLDDMRLSSVRSSPLMEAIERCLDLLDDDTMEQLRPRLDASMRSAVGLPSKVGSSRVLVTLSTRRLPVFRPFVDGFLRTIEKVVLDRNETVSSSYAVAAGYLARAATDKQLLRLIAFAKALYFDSEGDREAVTPRRSITAGEIVYAISKHAADRFNAISASVLPFVFVAKHDPNEHVKEQFRNAWDDSVGGSRAVALYLDEISALCSIYLESPQWVLKHTAARAVADAVVTLAALDKEIAKEASETLWAPLEKALAAKTWEGKEEVLNAFAKFVEAAKPFYSAQPPVAAAIVKIALREAKRQNTTYRQHSLKCLAQVCRARTDVDISEAVMEVVEPLIVEPANEADSMDVDGDHTASKADELSQIIISGAVESLLASINPVITHNEKLVQAITKAISTVAAHRISSAVVWRSTYVGLAQLFERLEKAGEGSNALDGQAKDPVKTLLLSVDDPGTEALRLLRADAITALVKCSPKLGADLESEIHALAEGERSAAVRDRLALAPLQPRMQ